jgi:hypothetical protein
MPRCGSFLGGDEDAALVRHERASIAHVSGFPLLRRNPEVIG